MVRMHSTYALLALAGASALAMLYVGAYQVRLVQHLKCPLVGGCEAVADAPFARPWGIPDGFLAAGFYAVLILLVLLTTQFSWARFGVRGLAILATIANILGVIDMSRLGAFCFYCLLTTVLSPFLVWLAFMV
jgi:uncharacterized membrane protein